MSGFIPGSRGSFMLDLVAAAMFVILPALTFGIHLVKNRKSYTAHKRMMLAITTILGIAVTLFELEMRFIGWRHLAKVSPYYDTVMPAALAVHLLCSISTTFLLITTVWFALRGFPVPPTPNQHSSIHKKLGQLSATGLFLTSVTGWIFYYVAFIAV